ncbi:hypothetical protein BJ165DRAFT_1616708 [Panaeolus papilionaceus]|nr:hypothetical protein BJ165DRAFT_1616708 [Panaeolus papilionaceus]
METPPPNEYKQINITGIPAVKLVKQVEYSEHDFNGGSAILILGPTGAGKSTFIEALASNTSLGISSNQLEGFTQSISVYQFLNVWHAQENSPIYLIDVPGFSDPKISEMKILSLLKKWREETGLGWFSRILYFMPINIPRLPGSQREVLQTFQALTGIDTAQGITVVTTMWDRLRTEAAKQRAEHTFNQLRDEIWKEYIEKRAEMLKFHNTQESALSILDHSFQRYPMPDFNLQSFVDSKVHIRETSYFSNLYNGLQTRLGNVHTELVHIQSELLGAAEEGDEELNTVLVPRWKQAQKLLAVFKKELQEFGDPTEPDPIMERLPGFDDPASEDLPYPNQPNADLNHRGILDRSLDWMKRQGKKMRQHRST